MTYHRLMIAAALFLAATCLKIYLPQQGGQALEAVQALIDEQSFALPLPEEALAWLDWS